jgi:hypothetical protein
MKKADSIKKRKKQGDANRPANFSIHRAVLDSTGDFLSAVIVEFIHYWFVRNDRKKQWLRIDFIHEQLPYISRAGLAKKVKKLVKEGHIIMEKGQGRHYHKCFYTPSDDMCEACSGKIALGTNAKVYYNWDMAEENLEAAVVYATIRSLLKVSVNHGQFEKMDNGTRILEDASKIGRVGDKLIIDTQKMVEGSGLSLNQVRKAVKWLIDHKKIEAKTGFGNKRTVWMPPNTSTSLSSELPTESYSHFDPAEDEPTEVHPHKE